MADELLERELRTRARLASIRAALLMCVAVVAVYLPIPQEPGDNAQAGGDFYFLHARRMDFARESIARDGTLPDWYPRELMGTPFWSNIQNFPFLPTRLLLFAFPTRHALTAGTIIAALLSALFTFAFARRVGLSPLAAAAAGWTFACSGFYASRVIAGELPLLEAYPALPLLLWLVDVNLGEPRRPRVAVAGLAAAALCVCLSGHPQLPFYAVVAAGVYLIWRGWRTWRRVFTCAAAMALGAGCAAFVLWPAYLLIGRSTRVLDLARSPNDIPFPYARLGAVVLPWKDGWPVDSLRIPGKPFTGFPNEAYFFDTVAYVGLLPLAAVLFLIGWTILRRQRPSRVAIFLTVIAIVALVTALPLFHRPTGSVAPTFIRSPSRQIYLTTFALAMACGAAIHLVAAIPARSRWPLALAGILLAAHVVDLGYHDRAFIQPTHVAPPEQSRSLEGAVNRHLGPGLRAGMDFDLDVPLNRRVDDVGFFDSIILARPYRTLFDLEAARPGFNTQNISGGQLKQRTLASLGVGLIVSTRPRRDLTPLPRVAGGVNLYPVPNPVPRATFLPKSAAWMISPEDMHKRMRDRSFNPHAEIMLPGQDLLPDTTRPVALACQYERPNSDEIVVKVGSPEHGYVRVLESFDPGWRAELDGRAVDVVPADDTFLCVAVPAGEHRIRFTYHTPGATTGAVMSLASLVLLGVLVGLQRTPISTSNVS